MGVGAGLAEGFSHILRFNLGEVVGAFQNHAADFGQQASTLGCGGATPIACERFFRCDYSLFDMVSIAACDLSDVFAGRGIFQWQVVFDRLPLAPDEDAALIEVHGVSSDFRQAKRAVDERSSALTLTGTIRGCGAAALWLRCDGQNRPRGAVARITQVRHADVMPPMQS